MRQQLAHTIRTVLFSHSHVYRNDFRDKVLDKSHLSSVAFMVNRFLVKLFNSNDMQTTDFCRLQFDFKLPSEQTVRNLLVVNF